MSGDRAVMITLTDGQVAQVLRQAPPQLASLLPEVSQLQAWSSAVLALLKDGRYSRATLRSLLVLNALPADGSQRDLRGIASELEISPSSALSYIRTWVALGLLEQNPRSRRYCRTPAVDTGRQQAAAGGADAG